MVVIALTTNSIKLFELEKSTSYDQKLLRHLFFNEILKLYVLIQVQYYEGALSSKLSTK